MLLVDLAVFNFVLLQASKFPALSVNILG